MENTDIRTIRTSFRASQQDDQMKISGTAVVFNQPSEDMGFIETITPDALNGVDLNNILLLYNHDFGNVLARTDAKNLQISVDNQGLHFEANLPNTTLARDVFTDVQAGNVKGCSFGFQIAPNGDEWELRDGQQLHTINQIEDVVEISLTPIPAYSETSVQVQRAFKKIKEEDQKKMEKDKEKEEKVETEKEETEETKEPKEKKAEEKDSKEEPKEERKKKECRNDEPSDKENYFERFMNKFMGAVDQKKPVEEKTQEEKGEKREMKVIKENDQEKEPVEVRNFMAFLRGEKRDLTQGFKEADGSAVIPEQILSMQKVPNDPNNLAQYINRVNVVAPTGRLPILAKASAVLATAEELAENPNIANASISKVNYDLSTYRGVLPISMEMVQDYPQIQGLLSQYVQYTKAHTEQTKIGAVIQKATPKNASSLDDIKSLYHSLINYGADRMFVVTNSMYALLDEMKDGMGRYLLNDNVQTATGKQLLGANVAIVPDEILGGGTKMFIGSLKAEVIEAVKGDISINWTENRYFENVLGVAIRMDFQLADTAAGYFVTYTDTSKASTVTSKG